MTEERPVDTIKDKVKEFIAEVLTPENNIDEIKKEIWSDLSDLYYKFGDELQKKAFREVIFEICKKIREDKWDTIYHKLYRKQEKNTKL